MSDWKDLAVEAAAKGSPVGVVLIILLVTGGLVQNQEPADHRVYVETRTICPSLLTEAAVQKSFPLLPEGLRTGEATGLAKTNGTISFELPEYSVALLSWLLPVLPAAGLARQGYVESFSGGRAVHPLGSAFTSGPLLQLTAVHILGQAGTFGASQLARFQGTNPGSKFLERCGQESATQMCVRASRLNLRIVELLPAWARPNTTTTTVRPVSSTSSTTVTPSNPCRCSRSAAAAPQNETDSYYDEESEDEDQLSGLKPGMPALCQVTGATFSELYSSLHENPKFSAGSFGAGLVTMVFGFYLLSRRRKMVPAPTETGGMSPPLSPGQEGLEVVEIEAAPTEPTVTPSNPEQSKGGSERSACLWTLFESFGFACLALAGFALLVNFYAQAERSGNELLVSISLGVAVQLGAVLWSSYGNLFFDLRRCRNLKGKRT